MFKQQLLHGFVSGIMAAIAAIIFNRIHFFATAADFSGIINPGTIISLNMMACILISVGYYFFIRFTKNRLIIAFHIFISILSFAAIVIPISISLPLSVSNPELFPGLAVPMIFFPVLAWYTFKPLFIIDKKNS
jgi:hypothetical protein